MGAAHAVVSAEAGLSDLHTLAERSPLPLEVIVHGPRTGMLMEHCLAALYVSSAGRADVCRGICRHADFALRDEAGEVRPIVCDQHCRTHLLTSHDLGALEIVEMLVPGRVRCLRIEGQFYDAALVGEIVRGYRLRLDRIREGQLNGCDWHAACGGFRDEPASAELSVRLRGRSFSPVRRPW